MANDITGNLILDYIIFPMLTGGGIVSLLTFLSDRLSKKRADYVNMSNERIKKFSIAQPYYIQLASYYGALSSELQAHLDKNKKEEICYQLCIYFICNILYLLYKFQKEVGIVQLDNVYVDAVILELMLTIDFKFQDPELENKVSHGDMFLLRALINQDTTYESFNDYIKSDKGKVYKIADKWLRNVEEKEAILKELEKKSRWYKNLISIEILIMYEIYYGRQQIGDFLQDPQYKQLYIDEDLLSYLKYKHPRYYKRLFELKLVNNSHH